MKIGVLALQGAFAEHEQKLCECGADFFEIRQRKDIETSFDGLILPGGESTVMGKLLNELGLMEPVRERIKNGMPVMGTCAGLILLAEHISGDETVHIGTMGITARRNAYGRQLGSFRTNAIFKGVGEIPMTFIRAPYIESVSSAEILSEINGKIVAARDKKQLALAFHPELEKSAAVHEYFLNMT
ncbi:MAG: pyridoxal 5'-phosphate synthase glutaminase subunit PdxT [Oscillospiraceae bacterium]|nr:pyridoxal 5'-phosphate synthase glutaminase subunit PdxT [Oscillospiraceae bacterium]MBQ8780723.1 pyridoxal 5'-phosphate synthase glutaminase subunit PdxT [Oscillospiraceae bacterium]